MILSEALEHISTYSRHYLRGEPLDYLTGTRKLTKETINKFELGYFPGFGKKLLKAVDKQLLRQYNVIYENGLSPYDKRIMFPLRDQYGELVAIVARTLSSEHERKYWHNPFSKGSYLYGLYYSKSCIRDSQAAFVCEGQVDLLTAFQHGIHNIVCSGGTALTEDQIILLSRYAKKIMLVFDSDKAGQEAIKRISQTRSGGARSRAGIVVETITLANSGTKEDLDSFLQKKGSDSFFVLANKTKKNGEDLKEYVAKLG